MFLDYRAQHKNHLHGHLRLQERIRFLYPLRHLCTTRNLVKNRACTGVCQGILNILGIKPKDIEPETILSLPEKNSPEKASAHRHLHRRIPTDRRIPRFAHRPETPARLMAAPAVHLILPLRKQKAYDGEHLSEQAHAVLHVRRHILPEAHSDR